MKEPNQCEGCQRGIPIGQIGYMGNKVHMAGEGEIYLFCTKDRYASPTTQEEKKCVHGFKDKIDCQECVIDDLNSAILEHTPTFIASSEESQKKPGEYCAAGEYHNPKASYPCTRAKSASSDWKEKEREAWKSRFAQQIYGFRFVDGKTDVSGIADYWLGRIETLIQEEAARVDKEIVICAAIRMPDGYVVRGHRHSDAIATARGIPRYKEKLPYIADDQGFMTSRNRYVTRKEGCEIQKSAGIKSHCALPADQYLNNELYSEDLY